MKGLKFVSMGIEHMHLLDSASYLPMPLRKLPEAFGLAVTKSWYPHYFNTSANLDYFGPMTDIAYFRADEMKESERREFMTWYEERRDEVFNNRRVLEQYCQDDVTVLREACQIIRRDFMEIGNIDVFLEAVTIASACNKVLRKQFLKPQIIGLIPTGAYCCNKNYSKKAIMWLLHMQQVDNYHIKHARNGLEYRLPELPNFSVDAYCEETRIVYEFLGCYVHGHTCQPFRDVPTQSKETLADRYERTMTGIDQITQAGYEVKIAWECDFDREVMVDEKPELLTHPIVQQTALNTRDALYGGRTEAICLYHNTSEQETVQYCDIMSLYPYFCKYGKYPVAHPTIHVGDTCKNVAACLKMEGLMKCSIVPPKRLYHPALPFR